MHSGHSGASSPDMFSTDILQLSNSGRGRVEEVILCQNVDRRIQRRVLDPASPKPESTVTDIFAGFESANTGRSRVVK